jgi:transcriptional regulator with XRE-family HTH domain
MELICKIADMRYRHGKISQQELSDRTGIAISTISAYENNKRIPNALTLWIISRAIGCRVDSLYDVKRVRKK